MLHIRSSQASTSILSGDPELSSPVYHQEVVKSNSESRDLNIISQLIRHTVTFVVIMFNFLFLVFAPHHHGTALLQNDCDAFSAPSGLDRLQPLAFGDQPTCNLLRTVLVVAGHLFFIEAQPQLSFEAFAPRENTASLSDGQSMSMPTCDIGHPVFGTKSLD